MGVPAWSQATITAVPSYDTVLRLRMDAIKFGCSAVYRYRRLGHSPIEVSATGESGRACKSLLSTVCVRGELTVAHRRDALALVVALASDRAGFVLRATRRWTLRMDRRTDAVARATRLALTGSGLADAQPRKPCVLHELWKRIALCASNGITAIPRPRCTHAAASVRCPCGSQCRSCPRPGP